MIDLTTLLQSDESETLEFKEQWGDAALEALAAFANTSGGTLLIGVTDKGQVAGWKGNDKQLQTIVNQVEAVLRIQPSLTVQPHEGTNVLVIRTTNSSIPVACRGHYYRHVGNTTRLISPQELGHFFVVRSGVKWDGIAGDYSINEIDEDSVRRFVRMARERLPFAQEDGPVESILEKLQLLQDGKLTRGAILLFGKNPQHHFLMAQIHMGRLADSKTRSPLSTTNS
ncbi:MAG: putative DNA binding domain-containing protein [Chloroflexi bacterium]|nr:putative DNA binding domain-containing protein [Chloroflexota bacterium]